jgi:hypothetical protein
VRVADSAGTSSDGSPRDCGRRRARARVASASGRERPRTSGTRTRSAGAPDDTSTTTAVSVESVPVVGSVRTARPAAIDRDGPAPARGRSRCLLEAPAQRSVAARRRPGQSSSPPEVRRTRMRITSASCCTRDTAIGLVRVARSLGIDADGSLVALARRPVRRSRANAAPVVVPRTSGRDDADAVLRPASAHGGDDAAGAEAAERCQPDDRPARWAAMRLVPDGSRRRGARAARRNECSSARAPRRSGGDDAAWARSGTRRRAPR